MGLCPEYVKTNVEIIGPYRLETYSASGSPLPAFYEAYLQSDDRKINANAICPARKPSLEVLEALDKTSLSHATKDVKRHLELCGYSCR